MNKEIAIIGLGYVGLPLAIEFGKSRKVVAFDISKQRIKELKSGFDKTNEVLGNDIKESTKVLYTSNTKDLIQSQIYIVTVPTPIDQYKKPDLSPLISACELVGEVLKVKDIVIFESTVYPGCTEEDCVPVLERVSGLKFNEDFFCGYSPERINPGDKKHRLVNIKKITSGSNPDIAKEIDELYQSIILEGTHLASSIKVAEASKVIENAQRDINIAFVNELAIIFSKLGIDTTEVLEAAGTKWNFLPFRPGLVGGHCIGVDPYYLTQKAESVGYHPEVILAGRRINDNMGKFIVSEFIKELSRRNQNINGSRVLILGFTFKENTPDIRNTKVIDLIRELNDYNVDVDTFDPLADKEEVIQTYNIKLIASIEDKYNGIIMAVSHIEFENINLRSFLIEGGVIYDVKSTLDKSHADMRL